MWIEAAGKEEAAGCVDAGEDEEQRGQGRPARGEEAGRHGEHVCEEEVGEEAAPPRTSRVRSGSLTADQRERRRR